MGNQINSKILVSVIIVNYNVTKEIDACLESLYRFCSNIELEIIVVDNNSPQRDIEKLIVKYSEVKFELLKENIGFGRANNHGIKKSKSEYILLLNPDTVLIEDFISPIINYIEHNNNAGACAPMLVYKNGSFQNSFGSKMGFIYETAEAFMFINLYRYIYNKYNAKKIQSGNVINVGWLSGACILIRTDILRSIGGFDEKYFLNYEDIDLCRKIEETGYNNYYFPSLKCIHLDHSSQKKNFEMLVYSRYQSRIIYASIHYNTLKRITIGLLHMNGLILRILSTPVFYSGTERSQRLSGYKKAFKLYLSQL